MYNAFIATMNNCLPTTPLLRPPPLTVSIISVLRVCMCVCMCASARLEQEEDGLPRVCINIPCKVVDINKYLLKRLD